MSARAVGLHSSRRGPREYPVADARKPAGHALAPSSSFTQLVGVWLRDLDPEAKIAPSAYASWRRFGAASECQDRHRPDNAWRRSGLMPER